MTIKERVADGFESVLRAWRGIPAGSDAAVENDLRDVVVRLANLAEVHYSEPPGLIHVIAEMVRVEFEPGGKTIRVKLEVSHTLERVEALAMMASVVTLRGYPAPEDDGDGTTQETRVASDEQMTIDEVLGNGEAGEDGGGPAGPEAVERGARYWDATGSYSLEVRRALAEPPTYKVGYDWQGKPFWVDIKQLGDRGTFAEAQADLDQYARDCNLSVVEEAAQVDVVAVVDGDLQPGDDDEEASEKVELGDEPVERGKGKRGGGRKR
jgi:hypothetical protein